MNPLGGQNEKPRVGKRSRAGGGRGVAMRGAGESAARSPEGEEELRPAQRRPPSPAAAPLSLRAGAGGVPAHCLGGRLLWPGRAPPSTACPVRAGARPATARACSPGMPPALRARRDRDRRRRRRVLERAGSGRRLLSR